MSRIRSLLKRTRRAAQRAAVSGAFCFTLGAFGCAVAAPRQSLPYRQAPRFSLEGNMSPAERWWEEFGDARLNEHVELALSNNFSLMVAYERIREARAVAGIEAAAQSPTLNATGSGAIRDGSGVDQQTEVSLGLEASYEVDLWGRIRSSVEAERLEASATAEDYQAAAITLASAVATAVYQRTEAALQLSLLESQLQTNRDVQTVLEERFAIGQSGSADVLRQRQLVESTIEQQITTRAAAEVLEHQLLALLGRPAQSESDVAPPASLPKVAGLPRIGLPSALLQRRPDVRAAYYRLESADASVAVAVKDQYPSLNLGAAVTTAAENPGGLFDTWLSTLAAQLVAPVVDGGRRRQEIERSVAVRRQRLAEYGDTVLTSFQEVEDALALEQRQLERINNLNTQLELSRTTYIQLRDQYLNGAADFIDVLVALRNQQELERSVLSARLARVVFRISLHRAIAGGFIHDAELRASLDAPPDDRTAGENQ